MQTARTSRPSRALASLAAATFLSTAPGAAQDTVAPGFAVTGSQPVPASFAAYHTLNNGDRVTFDGVSIDLYDEAGGFLMNLGALPGFVFTSFVESDPSETYALVGESTFGDIYKVMLDGSGLSAVANIPFHYDAVFEGADSALISASPCLCGTNEIYRLDLTGGAPQPIISVPGASGPVALSNDGDLYYATASAQFPAPPGSTDIVFWTADQLASGSTLTLGDATVFHSGLDGGAALAVDPVYGSLVLAEAVFGSQSRLLEFAPDGDLVGSSVTSSNYLSNVELRATGTTGHFHAWQPDSGVTLHYNDLDAGLIVDVRSHRPRAELVANGSAVTFRVTEALPNSAMLVLWGPQGAYDPDETSYGMFPGFLFHTGLPLASIRRLPFLSAVDGAGVGEFTYFDPGHLAGTLVFQALLLDGSGSGFVGSSRAVLN
ncbi:MAG: hypothetical protein QF903_09810 [Planctomycetota bacterium]|jgi:hypothetical protein|nr:hypothetical protein [Planctomycetota bacterium]MDP6763397.1 hypothetical protein [Planctomycetota bacterium]MDP6989760.1 hypothetical protein [Planctomycetota bacterium]